MAATATAMVVGEGVAKDVLYLNAWWHGDVAAAVAANLLMALVSETLCT